MVRATLRRDHQHQQRARADRLERLQRLCGSKAGLSMMSKTLAQEAGPFGVRVLCIAPGAIRTAINAAVWQDPAG